MLLTHAHFDHIYGLLELLERYPDCRIYTNEIGRETLGNAKLNMSLYHETPLTIEDDGADLTTLILGEGECSSLDDATKKLAEQIQKELDEANKKLKVPVEFSSAITKNPPSLLEDDMLINSKLIRPGLIEALFPMAENLYMVSYFIMQKDCIIACFCLGDLLDFVIL